MSNIADYLNKLYEFTSDQHDEPTFDYISIKENLDSFINNLNPEDVIITKNNEGKYDKFYFFSENYLFIPDNISKYKKINYYNLDKIISCEVNVNFFELTEEFQIKLVNTDRSENTYKKMSEFNLTIKLENENEKEIKATDINCG